MKYEVTTLFAVESNINEQLSKLQNEGYEIAGDINIDYNQGRLHYMIPMKRISVNSLDMELSELGISKRLSSAINANNSGYRDEYIITLRDLVNYRKTEGIKVFMTWRNFGKKSLAEIEDLIEPYLNIPT